MAFLDDHYLLDGATSESLYAAIKDLPIIDAHNHCDVKALAEDRKFTDIWEAEAATDHYVWECFRKCGVPEEFLTGKEKSNYEKWMAVAAAFPGIAGNPTYEWIHLDLKRRFGIDEVINATTAQMIWDRTKEMLATPEMSPQSLILDMNVEAMCSTDDPKDKLEYHIALEKSRLAGRVHPTFRPDKAVNIAKPGWQGYVIGLGERWGMNVDFVEDLLVALKKSHDYFAEHGCRASDHGTNVPWAYQVSDKKAGEIYMKGRDGEPLTQEDVIAFHSYMMNELAEMDAEKGWVFQMHIGAVRDVRDSLYMNIGPDSGGDLGDHETSYIEPLLPLLNRFDNRLKFVLYNMHPNHNATLAQLTRAFGSTVSLGLAWWLNDSFIGMQRQLEYVGSVDVLSNMSGMVSDSRKIMSYSSRHEMFRRTLSRTIGAMVDRGQMPYDVAEQLAVNLAYNRPKALFGL